MESKQEPRLLTFKRLQAALIAAVNSRILNGDYTERGLARILGVSQPQIHNVLKGARKLTPELADRILCKLNINLLDLTENFNLTGDKLPIARLNTLSKRTESERRKLARQRISNRLLMEEAS